MTFRERAVHTARFLFLRYDENGAYRRTMQPVFFQRFVLILVIFVSDFAWAVDTIDTCGPALSRLENTLPKIDIFTFAHDLNNKTAPLTLKIHILDEDLQERRISPDSPLRTKLAELLQIIQETSQYAKQLRAAAQMVAEGRPFEAETELKKLNVDGSMIFFEQNIERMNDLMTEIQTLPHPVETDAQIASLSRSLASAHEFLKNIQKFENASKPRMNLQAALEEAVDSARLMLLRDKGVLLQSEIPQSAVWVDGDAYALSNNLFFNLIKNAVEALNAKGTVTVRLLVEGSNAVIEIADTGKGMAKEELDKAVQGGYTAGKENGTGLGLKSAINTVYAHDGVIQIESNVGSGTKIHIKLPLSQSTAGH